MSKILHLRMSLAAVGLFACAGYASAQCCASGGSGSPTGKAASTGLGEAAPAATNLSVSPEWGVYEFSRDGITYVQINDVQGRVRAAVGLVGDTAWVMPMGIDVDKVSISSSSVLGSIIYSSEDFTVRVLNGESGASWIVVPRAKK
ncbi:hypothetical protein GGR77_001545 [Xanthomonas translucens]